MATAERVADSRGVVITCRSSEIRPSQGPDFRRPQNRPHVSQASQPGQPHRARLPFPRRISRLSRPVGGMTRLGRRWDDPPGSSVGRPAEVVIPVTASAGRATSTAWTSHPTHALPEYAEGPGGSNRIKMRPHSRCVTSAPFGLVSLEAATPAPVPRGVRSSANCIDSPFPPSH